MPEKNSAMDELNDIKVRYTSVKRSEDKFQKDTVMHGSRLLAPIYWRIFAVLLALFCGIFFVLAYGEITGITQRKAALKMLENRLIGGEQRLRELSVEIGKMTAQRESLLGEILKLEAEAASNAESAAENRVLDKTLPPLKEEYTQLLSNISSLREQKASLEGAVIDFQTKIAAFQATHGTQREGLQSLEEKLKDRRGILNDIGRQVAEKQAVVAGVTRSLADYETLLKLKESTYKERENSLQILKIEVGEGKRKIAEQEKTSASLGATVQDLQAKIMGMQSTHRVQKESLQSLEEELKGKRGVLNGIEKQLVEKQAAVAGASRSLADYKTQIQIARDTYEKGQKKLEDPERKQIALEKLIAEQETSFTSLRKMQASTRGRIDGLNIELTQIAKQIDTDRKQAVALEKRKSSLTSEVAVLETKSFQVDGLTEKIKTAKKELLAVKVQLEAQNKKAGELSQDNLQIEERIADRERKFETLESKLGVLEEKRLELAKDLSRMQGQQQALKQQKTMVKTDEEK